VPEHESAAQGLVWNHALSAQQKTAQILGIAETTVKAHLHRVFSKTGTNRQADLVKLAAGFSNPLTN
jgi:DNA-binding CsgD family transcriptional regulator